MKTSIETFNKIVVDTNKTLKICTNGKYLRTKETLINVQEYREVFQRPGPRKLRVYLKI